MAKGAVRRVGNDGSACPNTCTARPDLSFLLDTNERFKNKHIRRNAFKTNNSVDFYSIQTDPLRALQFPATPGRTPPIF